MIATPDRPNDILPAILAPEIFNQLDRIDIPESFGGNLLPNLRALTWFAAHPSPFPQVLTFISPSLRQLHIGISDLMMDEDLDFTSLNTTIGWVRRVHGLALARLSVIIPIHHNRPEAGQLQSSQLEKWLEEQEGLTDLTLLGIQLTSPTRTIGVLSQLRSLTLSLGCASAEALTEVTTTLAQDTPLLSSLSFTLITDLGSHPGWRYSYIPFFTIYPLTRLQHLISLDFTSTAPMPLEENDIAIMATAWPIIEQLSLCAHVIHVGRGTPLSALVLFGASFGKRLIKLGHWFGCEGALPGVADTEGKHFHQPLDINVGTSVLSKDRAEETAAFLAAMCPSGLLLARDSEDRAEEEEVADGWRTVSELFANRAPDEVQMAVVLCR